MADRSVVYRLVAETSQFKREMASAGDATRKAGQDMEGSGKKATVLSAEMGKAGAIAAAALAGKVVMAAADFDQAMSNVQAATHETAGNMDALREAAMQAGADTVFSAGEAAGAIENLAKAGVSTSDILGGGLTGALDLAAAGELDVASAAEIAATALTQFKLEGEDVPHVADLLAAAAGKAQGEVTDMAQALKQSGLVASQMGLSIEETTGTLAAFASAGLIGSDAGTSFRTMLLRMANPSKEAAKLMAELGINAYDAQGNFVGMAELSGQLQGAFKGQSQATRDAAMATIFGSDAIRAASVLYEQGQDGIEGWTEQVDDAGYAAETAAIKMDNLRGDVEELMGSIETAMIQSGESSQGGLRGIVQTLTEIVNIGSEAGPLLQEGFLPPSEVTDVGLAGLRKTRELIGGVIDDLTYTGGASKEALTSVMNFGSTVGNGFTMLSNAARGGASATDRLATSMEVAEMEAQSLKSMMDALNAVLEDRGSVRNYQAALDDMRASLKENGRSFDITTAKGRNNQAALDDIASSALDVADSLSETDRRKFLTSAIQDLRDFGTKFGVPKSETQALIDLLRTAKNTDVTPRVKIDGIQGASAAVGGLIGMLNGIPRNVTTTITTRRVNTGGMGPQERATGGHITGPGTATSDSIPAYLSNGEYVIRAAAVEKYGLHMFDRLNAMHFAGGGPVQGYARGGVAGTGTLPWYDARDQRAAEKTLEAAEALADAAEHQQDAAQAQYDAAKASVVGNMSADLFSGGSLASFDRALSKQAGDNAAFEAAMSQLVAMGLDGPLLDEIAAKGDLKLVSQLTSVGAAGIEQYEQLYASGMASANRTGDLVASQNGRGYELAQANQYAEASLASQERAEARLAAIEQAIRSQGGDMAAALDGTSAKKQRQQRAGGKRGGRK